MPASPLQFSFYPSDGEFKVEIKGVAKVDYTITYSHTRDGQEVKEALKGGGKANQRSEYSAKHFAGTQSAEAKVPHQVKGGEIMLTATDSAGVTTQYKKVFTISKQGVVETKDASPSVLGAASESAELSLEDTALTTTATSARPTAYTSSPSPSPVVGNGENFPLNPAGWQWLALGVGLLIVTLGIGFRLLRKPKNSFTE